jgi:predicted DNA-binding transcriptional regulator AlpA
MTPRPPRQPAPAEPPPKSTAAETDHHAVPIADRLTWGLDDLTALTGLSRRTLERERSAGRLPKPDLKVGKRVLWTPATIRRWLAEGGAR